MLSSDFHHNLCHSLAWRAPFDCTIFIGITFKGKSVDKWKIGIPVADGVVFGYFCFMSFVKKNILVV